jgi:hypothetical protein
MTIEIDMPMAEKTLGPFLQERITYSMRCSLCKFGLALITTQHLLSGKQLSMDSTFMITKSIAGIVLEERSCKQKVIFRVYFFKGA